MTLGEKIKSFFGFVLDIPMVIITCTLVLFWWAINQITPGDWKGGI